MFCSQCGTNLPDGVQFCSSCGAKIITAEGVKSKQSNIMKSEQNIPSLSAVSEKKPSFKNKGLIIGITIVALIAVIVIIKFAISGSKDNNGGRDFSEVPFSKITYNMTKTEGRERYGEPYYSSSGYYDVDFYEMDFMGLKGTFYIEYLNNYFLRAEWINYNIDRYIEDGFGNADNYNDLSVLKSKSEEIEKLYDDFMGVSGEPMDFSNATVISWMNKDAEKAVKDGSKKYAASLIMYDYNDFIYSYADLDVSE